jgi:hypothetical protein
MATLGGCSGRSGASVQARLMRRRRAKATLLSANARTPRAIISPGKSDQSLGRAALPAVSRSAGGLGAGRARSPARVRWLWGLPLGLLIADRSRLAVEEGRRLARTGVPGPAAFPPVADGMFSQYWLTALTVGFEQGAPGWLDAAADTSGASSTAAATSRQSSACLPLSNTAWAGC